MKKYFSSDVLLKKVGQPGLFFVYFRSFQTQYYRKTVDFNGIRTRIVGIEGKLADYLTTTTAQEFFYRTYCTYLSYVCVGITHSKEETNIFWMGHLGLFSFFSLFRTYINTIFWNFNFRIFKSYNIQKRFSIKFSWCLDSNCRPCVRSDRSANRVTTTA